VHFELESRNNASGDSTSVHGIRTLNKTSPRTFH